MVDCDVVVFTQPSMDCSVFVTNVPTSADEELLLEVFGKCGLVHDVHKFNPENLKRKADDGVTTTCVSVKYYTRADAKRAIAELNQYNLEGVHIKVIPSKPMRDNLSRNLSFPKSVEVCNYFLGFHKWSTRVIAMKKVVHEEGEEGQGGGEDGRGVAALEIKSEVVKGEEGGGEEKDKDKPVVQVEFQCEVELKLDGKKVIGIGNGKHSGRFPPKVYEIARKLSITNARKKAFSKCALMVLNNGKVKVYVNDEAERKRQEEEEGEVPPEAILASLNVYTIEAMQAKQRT